MGEKKNPGKVKETDPPLEAASKPKKNVLKEKKVEGNSEKVKKEGKPAKPSGTENANQKVSQFGNDKHWPSLGMQPKKKNPPKKTAEKKGESGGVDSGMGGDVGSDNSKENHDTNNEAAMNAKNAK